MNKLELERRQVEGVRTALRHMLKSAVPDGYDGHRIQDLLEPGFEKKEYCFWQRIFQKLVESGLVEKLGTTRLSYLVRDDARAEEAIASDDVIVDLLWPETQVPADVVVQDLKDPGVPTEADLLLALLEMMPKVVDGIDSLARRLDRIETALARMTPQPDPATPEEEANGEQQQQF